MLKKTMAALGVACAVLATPAAMAQTPAPSRPFLTIAMPIDPQQIDPSTNTVNVTAIIIQNVFETLYTFDADWRIQPMLAAEMPVYGDGGKVVTIKLREGVKFHNGAVMTAADVVASLARWQKLSVRGRLAGEVTEELRAVDPLTVQIRLKRPFATLIPMMAFFNAAAAIMPEANAKAAMGGPMTNVADFVGTGPYRLVERKPDQYVRMVRFDDYSALDRPASGYAGKREALVPELRFVPVPNTTTRVQSILSGQYDVADNVPTEFAQRIRQSPNAGALVVKWSGWIQMIMNSREGIAANPGVRKAVQAAIDPEAILLAAFGSPEFFALTPSLYPEGAPFHATAGSELYNQKNPAKAKQLLAAAGYKGETFRILTSQQYDFIYKAALVTAQNLQEAGFTVDVQLMDWASVMEQRSNPKIWDAFLTFHNFVPEPSLITFMNPSFPGWWDTPGKRAALDAFTSTLEPDARKAAWATLQGQLMADAQSITIGNYYALMAYNKRVSGLQPVLMPPYWNVSNPR